MINIRAFGDAARTSQDANRVSIVPDTSAGLSVDCPDFQTGTAAIQAKLETLDSFIIKPPSNARQPRTDSTVEEETSTPVQPSTTEDEYDLNEVVITIDLQSPRHCKYGKKDKDAMRIKVTGSTTLSSLAASFYCPSDDIITVPPIKDSFMYIESTFYTSDENAYTTYHNLTQRLASVGHKVPATSGKEECEYNHIQRFECLFACTVLVPPCRRLRPLLHDRGYNVRAANKRYIRKSTVEYPHITSSQFYVPPQCSVCELNEPWY
jgi:hypothetical protein